LEEEIKVPISSVKEPALAVPASTQRGGGLSFVDQGIDGHVDASALGAAIEYHRTESQRLAKAATQHRNELRELLRRRDQHIAQLQASGLQLTHIASLYKVTKARIAQITKAFRTAGEHLAAPGGDAR
jgi:hypothetical protein